MASAASSSGDTDLMVINDLNVVAVALYHDGRNPGNATGPLAIPDEEYAAELQIQEVIVSSAMAAAIFSSTMAATASQSSLTPLLHGAVHHDTAAVETPAVAVVECIPSSSSSPPALGGPAVPGEGTAPVADAEVCKICLEHVLPADAHRASRSCAHAFCTACLDRHIIVKNQDGVSDVMCPGEDCGSVLDPELCQGIISRETFEGWSVALCKSMVLRDSNVCYCPFKDCSEMMVDDHGGEVVTESECPVCRRLFCARCRVPWHAGITCAEYEQLAPGDRGKEDLVALEMAKGKKWRSCHRCKFWVERHEGCVHITCRCGFQFCYGCGEPWGQGHSCCNAG
ncbi:hypothetical protein BS78_05G244600 [Paspalum vaginatum]|nr:hypothetical protein BS78_05G244600 [Paspalum vaginatum]KAJ1276818.1 hypothetical protein BS78_05G244600 [Paspalum vaginatum]